MSTTFVQFTDRSTGSILVGGGTNGWTPVDSESFDQALGDDLTTAQNNNTSSTSSLPLMDSGVAVQVEAAAAAGHALQTEVASYDAAGRLTSDYLLNISFVAANQATLASDSDGVDNLTLKVVSYTSKTISYDPSGTATTTSSGYSFLANSPISTPAPAAPTDSSSLTASAAIDAPTHNAPDTYVVLQKSDNTYIASENRTSFPQSPAYQLPSSNKELSDVQNYLQHTQGFVSQLTLMGSNSNTGAFSYGSPADLSSPIIFKTLASGAVLNDVEFIQINPNSQTSQTSQASIVSDTVFRNILVTGVTYQLGDDGADARLYQFQAGASTYTTSHENSSSVATTGSFPLVAPATVAPGIAATPVVNPSTIEYQLTIGSGANATTTDINQATFSIQRNGANTTFSNLTFTFNSAPSAAVQAALLTSPGNLSIAQIKAGNNTNGFVFDTMKFVTSAEPKVALTSNGDGTNSYTYTLHVSGFQEKYTAVQPNGRAGTSADSDQWNRVTNVNTGQTSLQQVCYCSGTQIRAVDGEVAVENLVVGDLVVTSSGDHRPIRWLGHRTVDPRQHPCPKEVFPICVCANAFGPGKPVRDLFVSPGHAICVDVGGEVLIPAASLVNGSTIRREDVDQVTYWHVELDSHDLLLAEGLAAESYLDTGNRSFFAANGTDRPDAAPGTHADFCRPFHYRGPTVEAARAMLTARAESLGWRPDRDAGLHLLVDGKRVDPLGEGDVAIFLFSARARDVKIVSRTFVPATLGGKDMRTMGLRISGLCLSGSGGDPSRVDLDDPALAGAFHESERVNARSFRWTAAAATPLPPTLWSGLTGMIALHLAHAAATVRGYGISADRRTAENANKGIALREAG